MIASILDWATGPGWSEVFTSPDVKREWPTASAWRARHSTAAVQQFLAAIKPKRGG